jgi:hypothetical protein
MFRLGINGQKESRQLRAINWRPGGVEAQIKNPARGRVLLPFQSRIGTVEKCTCFLGIVQLRFFMTFGHSLRKLMESLLVVIK